MGTHGQDSNFVQDAIESTALKFSFICRSLLPESRGENVADHMQGLLWRVGPNANLAAVEANPFAGARPSLSRP